tara:strand:- start:249 stop:1514 length:1266 start_codon:yes stop_codon:yes gene_type:complete
MEKEKYKKTGTQGDVSLRSSIKDEGYNERAAKNDTQTKVVNIDGSKALREEKKSNIDQVDDLIRRDYPDTSFNVIAETTDFGIKGKTFESVITQIKKEKIVIGVKDFENYLKSDMIEQFDPFIKYYDSLIGEWNEGDPDYLEMLADHVKTPDQKLFNSMFKKHMVRAVSQATKVEQPNRFVLVLRSSKESLGKSTFIRFLNPLGDEYLFEHLTNDVEKASTKCLIYNLEELEGLNKGWFNRLKSVISSSSHSSRKMFSSQWETRPRKCSFFASTNEDSFLGGGDNTRWLVFSIVEIDFGYSKSIDIHKVWSQAKYLSDNGFEITLTEEEKEQVKQVAAEHRYGSTEEEYIMTFFRKSTRHKASATQIERVLNAKEDLSPVKAQKIGRTLSEMGYKKGRTIGGGKAYWIETIKEGYPLPPIS